MPCSSVRKFPSSSSLGTPVFSLSISARIPLSSSAVRSSDKSAFPRNTGICEGLSGIIGVSEIIGSSVTSGGSGVPSLLITTRATVTPIDITRTMEKMIIRYLLFSIRPTLLCSILDLTADNLGFGISRHFPNVDIWLPLHIGEGRIIFN